MRLAYQCPYYKQPSCVSKNHFIFIAKLLDISFLKPLLRKQPFMAFSRNLRRSGVSEHALTKPQALEDLPYLTDEQETSFQLLLEWQKARNTSIDLEKDAKAAESRVSSSTTEKLVRYQDILAKLKSSEFEGTLKRIGRKRPAEKNLRTLRQQAAYYAACERIASSFWTASPPKADALLTKRMPLYGASLVPELEIDYGLPHYIWDSQRNEVRTSLELGPLGGRLRSFDSTSWSSMDHSSEYQV
ncbi:hypothetical protein IQ07DRAFT_93360 [Pyrenochaeta sp. DS3sAY3a]|nr:hypothetical protein IQ07DRAFT_93360 [Pyrenochaeta sp. DS3sAY3a]